MNDLIEADRGAFYIEPPPDGIYPDIPFGTYLRWNAISNSRLSLASKSLAHFDANPSLPVSPSLTIGSLTHTGHLEPLEIGRRYAVMPDFARDPENVTDSGKRSKSPNTRYVTDRTDEFHAANEGKEIVTADQYNQMMAMVASLKRDKRASAWFGKAGKVEQSLVWTDPATGLRCKCRVDFARSNWEMIVDLKTTRDATTFEKSIANFGYHRQMAHYINGASCLTGITPKSGIAVVETLAPYCTRTAPMSDAAVEQGRQECADLLRKVATAKQTGHWTGYPSPDEWTLPRWYRREIAPTFEVVLNGETLTFEDMEL